MFFKYAQIRLGKNLCLKVLYKYETKTKLSLKYKQTYKNSNWQKELNMIVDND